MLKINDAYTSQFINREQYECFYEKSKQALLKIKSKSGAGNDFLGWYDLPENYDRDELMRIKAAQSRISKNSDVLVVIGIGGSYLGARAAIEFIKSPLYNNLKKDTPDIYFAGNNISSTALNELISICEGKDISVNVISKSGTTTEPAIAFRVFKALLEEKYGKNGARERIFVTTDKARGTLKEFSDKAGYETFTIPDDVGGRYSVLTAVGLLPIAVAGIDVDELLKGANDAKNKFTNENLQQNDVLKYSAIRNSLLENGKTTEIFVGYEPYIDMISEWWKQLFGESEGKENRGIFPASAIFSTDLHSLGQYIQEGRRDIFETVISINDINSSFTIPYDKANVDGLNFLAGKTLNEVNKTAMTATAIAHTDGGVPNIIIELSKRDAYCFGYLVYFFELACAVSGYVLSVNPFNQPGVEAYKRNMFALLGKPGYEELLNELKKRM
jgi:glucose-6-phosphate isomerase